MTATPARGQVRRPGRTIAAAATLAAVVALGVAGWLMGARPAWFTTNVVESEAPGPYPEVASRRYAEPPDAMYARLRAAAESIPRWRVVAADEVRREVRVEITTALPLFVDDLTARVVPEDAGCRVAVVSRSRVGRGDLGENFRHVRALQQRMEARPVTLQGP